VKYFNELFYIARANFDVKFDAIAANPSRDNGSLLITMHLVNINFKEKYSDILWRILARHAEACNS